MTFNEYDTSVQRTMSDKTIPTRGSLNVPNIIYLAFGLAGETGETVDMLKKWLFHGVPLDEEKLKKELGDALYHISGLAEEFGWSTEVVAIANDKKLRARYPNGFVEGGGIREGEGA